ncbi:MAG: ABC transporter ATP-binding protein [Patescibacteria group bacterium]|nr:ABC transporter ATP-binding protein [Patescibacteria group bacterium]
MIVLELAGASKVYNPEENPVYALIDADLRVKRGEFIAIIGASGSGKSTMINLAGCLDTPSSGKVIIDGHDVSNLSEAELAKIRNEKIGFIFQSYNLIPKINALENVSLPLLYKGISAKKRKQLAEKVLNQVGLKERASHMPNQLSGGEQQRVAIARALITNPSLIIADEPTGNLDSKSGKAIMKIISSLHKKGKTIMTVTHDLNIAKLAERKITLKDGKIINGNS